MDTNRIEILIGGHSMKIKIYTKTGDKGKTSLYDGTRVDKDSTRVEAYGTVDELNSALAVAKNYIDDKDIFKAIEHIQRKLFNVAGELATSDGASFPERVTEEDIKYLENIIDTYIEKMGSEQEFQFILPGSGKASAHLHLARTICRRAERRILKLTEEAEVSQTVMKYVNRLSDAIYSMGRYLEVSIELIEFDK